MKLTVKLDFGCGREMNLRMMFARAVAGAGIILRISSLCE